MVTTIEAVRVLIATDGSEHAETAVRLVAGMAWPEGTAFRIIEVVSALDDIAGALLVDAPQPIGSSELSDSLRRAAALLRGVSASVETVMRHGRAADRIVEEAAAFDADLIAVGHRGRGPIGSILLGSVASDVVQRSAVPVLVARGDRIDGIVLGDDGSAPARAAREAIATWPGLRGSRVTVVSAANTLEPLKIGIAPTMRRAAEAARREEAARVLVDHEAIARAAAAELRSRGVQADGIAVTGEPAKALIDAAARVGARLIVVGSRGRGGVTGMLGSVARAVVTGADRSVLIVHAAR